MSPSSDRAEAQRRRAEARRRRRDERSASETAEGVNEDAQGDEAQQEPQEPQEPREPRGRKGAERAPQPAETDGGEPEELVFQKHDVENRGEEQEQEQEQEQEPERQGRGAGHREPEPEPVPGAPLEQTAEIVRRAREALQTLQGSKPESVSSLERTHSGWTATFEVVELSRVPDSTDVMASYEVVLDEDTNVTRCARVRRYYRSQADLEAGS